jgi:ABC-type phosphate/phosphonate transport system permease subunit
MKDVDVDVEYLGGLSLTIKIVASITLPGTFLEVPASALINLNHLKGKVNHFIFLEYFELIRN